jgi:uncharacterized OB-fold protein
MIYIWDCPTCLNTNFQQRKTYRHECEHCGDVFYPKELTTAERDRERAKKNSD